MPRPLRRKRLKPFWQTSDKRLVRLYHGDVIRVLHRLPAKSVQMVVTSPPYWGLRDYQTDKALEIGSERTVDEFVEKMVEVFREVWRVLRDDGTVWLNLGDSYGKQGLMGAPWQVALALQADGWALRQDIIWAKPSPMPENVRNRCTRSHEYLLLLTKKRGGYFCDMEAIREKISVSNVGKVSVGPHGKHAQEIRSYDVVKGANKRSVWTIASESYEGAHFATFPKKLVEPCVKAGTSEYGACLECGAPWKRVVKRKTVKRYRPNKYVKRSPDKKGIGNVIDLTNEGVNVKTFGWKPGCICSGLEVIAEQPRKPGQGKKESDVKYEKRLERVWVSKMKLWYTKWKRLWPKYQRIKVKPCVVLDPFVGSGTTCVVALGLGRRSWGIDLSETYLTENAIPRIEGALLSRPALAGLVGRVPKRVLLGEEIGE